MSNTKLKELTEEELKSTELQILTEVDSICRSRKIRYSIIGGTLLGAVRHHGFIPWDDDIDVVMPRPDFDRFVEYCSVNETPFDLKCIQTDPSYGSLHAKACDKKTILKDKNVGSRWNCQFGVFIDIFPLDGLGDTPDEARKTFRKTAFKRELLVAANWKRYFRSNTHSAVYEPIRFFMYLISRPVSNRNLILSLENEFRKKNFDSVKYCAPMSGSYREKEILPISLHDKYILLKFENKQFYAIADYDKYLSSVYGNYMELPPVEKRVSHHTFNAFWREQ